MPQTLLAILALMMLSLFTYQQQRNILNTQLDMIRTESATQSAAVAIDVLEDASLLAYDESTKGGTAIDTPDSLHLPVAVNEGTFADDLNDLHMRKQEVTRLGEEDPMRFIVETRVAYAKEDDPDQVVDDAYQRTKFKKVTAKVYAVEIAQPDTVVLFQTYSCGTRCAW